MSEYLPKLRPLGRNVIVEQDWCKYATKADLKNSTNVDILKSAKKLDLANLKSETDELDIGKLETTPVDLITLIHAAKSEVVKKTKYSELLKCYWDHWY